MMQDNLLFEYAVIRVVPRVERQEFANVGVILFCKERKFLKCLFDLDEGRLRSLYPKIDIAEISEYTSSFKKICAGGKDGGPIGTLPLVERFRWLTATRSTVLQTSHVHPGLCTDPEVTLNKLFSELVTLAD